MNFIHPEALAGTEWQYLLGQKTALGPGQL